MELTLFILFFLEMPVARTCLCSIGWSSRGRGCLFPQLRLEARHANYPERCRPKILIMAEKGSLIMTSSPPITAAHTETRVWISNRLVMWVAGTTLDGWQQANG